MTESENEERNENEQEEVEEKLFFAERAKTGRSKCKRCKNTIASGTLRVAKAMPNPFGSGKMKVWHHLNCIFEAFKKQRATTPKIEKIDDIGGYEMLSENDIQEILQFMSDDAKAHWDILKKQLPALPTPGTPSSNKKKDKKKASTAVITKSPRKVTENSDPNHKDNSFRQFRKICLALAEESGHIAKTKIMKEFFSKGTDGESFKGDLLLWCRLLLTGTIKTVYNLQSKQLIKIFSRVFKTDSNEMLTDLEAGDVALTIGKYFEESNCVKPASKSILSLQDVDTYLQKLSTLTKEDEQQKLLTEICKKCTGNDLLMFVRFIKNDIKTSAGPKYVLDALHPDAYDAFKTSRDINAVIDQITEKNTDKKALDVSVKLMTPVLPMLAQACKSLEKTINKYKPGGLYVEIKYDGERVQLHKQGFDFKYFSRSLKPVLAHKVNHFASYIKKAFPFGEDIVLDCEVLMIDMKTGDPLPFGSLGKHKKDEFKNANPCLYVFDCLYYNGESLLNRTLKERYDVLHKNMNEIPNHIQFSEKKLIKDLKDLESMLADVIDKGLEGLVLKDPSGTYEPGKRHWIKVKRDYLFEGKAADTVDLVVMGAWYGTGHKGGMMNVFLMGCYDTEDECWRSVTKVHGLDDETLETLQTELDMMKISREASRVPSWLNVTKAMVPDFVARDPKAMPVWEITGHEFTKHDVHTADGISIRFPRVVKRRFDKTWETATTLNELKNIFEVSKTNAGSRLRQFFFCSPSGADDEVTTPSPTKKGRKRRANESDASDFSEETSPVKKPRKLEFDDTRKRFPKLLPDLLSGKVIRMKLPAVSDMAEFRRHLIAYGAEVIDDKSTKKATHEFVVGTFSTKTDKDGKERPDGRISKVESRNFKEDYHEMLKIILRPNACK